jgi:hypothetical protein
MQSGLITCLSSDLSRACQKIQLYGTFVSGLRHVYGNCHQDCAAVPPSIALPPLLPIAVVLPLSPFHIVTPVTAAAPQHVSWLSCKASCCCIMSPPLEMPACCHIASQCTTLMFAPVGYCVILLLPLPLNAPAHYHLTS